MKKVFIVLTHYYVPSQTKAGAWEVKEKADFIDSLRNRHYKEATSIVDFIDGAVIKDRNNRSYDELLEHLDETFPEQMKQLITEYK